MDNNEIFETPVIVGGTTVGVDKVRVSTDALKQRGYEKVVHCRDCEHSCSHIFRLDKDGQTETAIECDLQLGIGKEDFYCGCGILRGDKR